MIQFANLTDDDMKGVADHLRSQAAGAATRGDHAAAIRLYDEAANLAAASRVTHVRDKSGREIPVGDLDPFVANVLGVNGDAA